MKHATEDGPSELGYATPDITRRLDLAPSTLHSWLTRPMPLVVASLVDGTGKRNTRYWTPADYVLVRVVKSLRQAGCPYDLIEQARPLVQGHLVAPSPSDHLHWDGSDLIEITAWDEVVSRGRLPGQMLFHRVATPLQAWLADARQHANRYDKAAVEGLRRSRRQRSARTREQTI